MADDKHDNGAAVHAEADHADLPQPANAEMAEQDQAEHDDEADEADVADLPQPAPVKPAGPVNVTYHAGDGDPAEVMWNFVRFKANVPTKVTNPTMIELAKGNPTFEVEGHPRAQKAPRDAVPKTSGEYRAYAVRWFKRAKTGAEFDQRWENEADLREKVGVGHDDLEWLSSIGDPIRAELKKTDDAQSE